MQEVIGIVVAYEDRIRTDFKAPAKYYIVNACGDAVYYGTRSRAKAQTMADQDWGVGKYTIRVEQTAQIR